jgi:hypothetical protein
MAKFQQFYIIQYSYTSPHFDDAPTMTGMESSEMAFDDAVDLFDQLKDIDGYSDIHIFEIIKRKVW